MLGIWKNKKTKELYMVSKLALNANNNSKGDIVVIYMNCMSKRFTRNSKEFTTKFEPVLLLSEKRKR